jgi:hypothetical protein
MLSPTMPVTTLLAHRTTLSTVRDALEKRFGTPESARLE